jgi:6-pyruvoyltetrahydropterin/6-carboxytetrahydropterin synthase
MVSIHGNISVTKKFKFDAAHSLPNYDGKCKNLHGHGFQLEIEVSAIPSVTYKSGMVIDFSLLKKIVDTLIISILDHSYLNDTIPNPTAENIVYWIVNQLYYIEPFSKEAILTKVRLYETEDSYAEWRKTI